MRYIPIRSMLLSKVLIDGVQLHGTARGEARARYNEDRDAIRGRVRARVFPV